MNDTLYYPDWHEQITYAPTGPQPTVLRADDKAKIILAGLDAGQRIPEHPEAASLYHFLETAGAVRGLEAHTRLAFLAVRLA